MAINIQTSGRRYRLGFIGGGKLAGSVMRGLVRAQFCPPDEIVVSEPNDAARDSLGKELGIATTNDNCALIRAAEVVLIGVKPNVVLQVLAEISPETADRQIISLAAGIGVSAMEKIAPGRCMRAMTNTPAAVCQAATAIAPGARTTPEDLARAREIFSAIGSVVEVREEQIDAVTALSGSGPAFVYSVIEALAKGGELCGLPEAISLKLATQTVRGAAQLALESGLSPEELRRMVITPGGTTAAGLQVMKERATSEGIADAVTAAAARAKELMPAAPLSSL